MSVSRAVNDFVVRAPVTEFSFIGKMIPLSIVGASLASKMLMVNVNEASPPRAAPAFISFTITVTK